MARARKSPANEQTAANLGFEADLWAAADLLRGNIDAADYKHVVLGLIFLKYVSDAFAERHAQLLQEAKTDLGVYPEDPDEYAAKNVYWVAPKARWQHLRDNAKSPEIGKLVDDAMKAIEDGDKSGKLRGVLPRDYSRPALDKARSECCAQVARHPCPHARLPQPGRAAGPPRTARPGPPVGVGRGGPDPGRPGRAERSGVVGDLPRGGRAAATRGT